jgi:hypothetical protein
MGRQVPAEAIVTEGELDVLYVSPEAFRRSPQVGVPCLMPWSSLQAYLRSPSVGDSKEIAGGYALGAYSDNVRRKANLLRIRGLVLDFDESSVSDVAMRLTRYRAVIHETFSSLDDAPRCRAIVELAEDVDAKTYDALHAIVRAFFRAADLPADEGAKDPCRLSYSPVRRPGAGYGFAVTDGVPLDAAAVLSAQPPRQTRPAWAPLPRPKHRDAYVAAALRRASDAVARATPGQRHHALCREAFAVARFEGLAEHEIHGALLGPFVRAAGEQRKREGERTIADAIRARRGAV